VQPTQQHIAPSVAGSAGGAIVAALGSRAHRRRLPVYGWPSEFVVGGSSVTTGIRSDSANVAAAEDQPAGPRIEADPEDIIRVVGNPVNGVCGEPDPGQEGKEDENPDEGDER